MIRVILVDDHALVREGVSRLLAEEPDIRVVGAFADGQSAVRFAARDEPDVAILDISMPGASGIDVARRLRAVSPRTRRGSAIFLDGLRTTGCFLLDMGFLLEWVGDRVKNLRLAAFKGGGVRKVPAPGGLHQPAMRGEQ